MHPKRKPIWQHEQHLCILQTRATPAPQPGPSCCRHMQHSISSTSPHSTTYPAMSTIMHPRHVQLAHRLPVADEAFYTDCALTTTMQFKKTYESGFTKILDMCYMCCSRPLPTGQAGPPPERTSPQQIQLPCCHDLSPTLAPTSTHT